MNKDASERSLVRFVERRHSDSEKWRRYADSDIIPAWVADMDCTVAEPIISALRQRVEHGVFGYSSASAELPEIIADYFSRRWNWTVQAEWLLYSPGLGASIHNVCRMATGEIITPSPIYHVFRHAPAIADKQRVDIPMEYDDGEWRLPMEVMQAAQTANSSVFQLCNPHNPNGKVYTRAELLALGEFCLRHNLLICADEVHADLILDSDKEHIPIASLSPEIAERTITMQSPSKAFNVAGLNFAVIVIPDADLRRRYQQAARGKVLSNLNPFGFLAAAAAWGGACDSWLEEMRGILRTNRDSLAAAITDLEGINMPHLSATYLAWLNVERLGLADAPAHFRRFGLGLSPGADFGDERYMRLNFGCSPSTCDDIIARLKQAVHAAH